MLTETSIRDIVVEDLDRLETLFADYQIEKPSDFARARELFKEFMRALHGHILWEENVLFPLFEQKVGLMEGGLTTAMRAEHRRLGAWVEAVQQKLNANDPHGDVADKALREALLVHVLKEQDVFCPTLGRLLTDEEKAAALEAWKNPPGAPYRESGEYAI